MERRHQHHHTSPPFPMMLGSPSYYYLPYFGEKKPDDDSSVSLHAKETSLATEPESKKRGASSSLYSRFLLSFFASCFSHKEKQCEKQRCVKDASLVLGSLKEHTAFLRFGKLKYTKGRVYEGQLTDDGDKKCGTGLMCYANGDVYVGQWECDVRQGWGAYMRDSGSKYEGLWYNDLRSDYGVETSSGGVRYIGSHRRDKREGVSLYCSTTGTLIVMEHKFGVALSKTVLTDARTSTNNYVFHNSYFPKHKNMSKQMNNTTSETHNNLCREKVTEEKNVGNPITAKNCAMWTCREVQSFISVIGEIIGCMEIVTCFSNHRISGDNLELLLEEENLIDVLLVTNTFKKNSIDNESICLVSWYGRRLIILAIQTVLMLEQRLKRKKMFASHSYKERISTLLNHLVVDASCLSIVEPIGIGGFAEVYRAFLEPSGFTVDKNDSKRSQAVNNSSEQNNVQFGVALKMFRAQRRNSRGNSLLLNKTLSNQITKCVEKRELWTKAILLRGLPAEGNDNFLNELDIWERLRHPNITLLLGVLKSPCAALVTEYVKCGTLFDLVHRHRLKLSLTQIITLAREIAMGMNYLHEKRILHCDLKSSNILLEPHGGVKICDFGLATHMDERTLIGCVGTQHWTAPEVLRGEAFTSGADVYSYGMILWEMINSKIPYEGQRSLACIGGAVGYGGLGVWERGGCWTPKEIKSLMSSCLELDARLRPSFANIVEAINKLIDQNVISIEENLRMFFGENVT